MAEYIKQHTLARPVSHRGIGVHSGKEIHMTVHPARENHGIKFRRVDLPGTQDIQALFKRVVDTSLATVIGINGAIVSTIEHLMATFAGLGVDNALVEVDEYEMPIMDGSAEEFTRQISQAGLCRQNAPRHYFIVKQVVEVKAADKYVAVRPGNGFKITCSIDFDHPVIGEQSLSYDDTASDFERDISRARTFGFVRDLDYLKMFSLGKGGSLDNAIVMDQDKVLNKEGLRFEDEFVRHKILDSLGDFSLLGMPIQGHVVAHKSGHTLNHQFIRKFLEEKNAWDTGPVQQSQ